MEKARQAIALTIGGSDPSGGAGLQADLKTFQQCGVYGMSVVTLITVQNTVRVERVHVLEPELVRAQWEAVTSDISPRAIKLGALGTAEIVHTVADCLQDCLLPIVVDPVIVSKHGHALASDDVIEAYRQRLLPMATLITPNLYEAKKLCGARSERSLSSQEILYALHAAGAKRILLKAGHHESTQSHWYSAPEECLEIQTDRIANGHEHGTGCVLSALTTAYLARGSSEPDWEAAIRFAIAGTLEAIRFGSKIGHGVHPADMRGLETWAGRLTE